SYSTIPQFSGPFKPRPALTTLSASLKGTEPVTLFVLVTFTFGASTVAENGTTSAVPSPETILYELGFNAMILISVFKEMLANPFPEKTFFLTIKPSPVSGNAMAPITMAAFNLIERRVAIVFPSELFENTMTLAPIDVATSAIILV